MATGSNEKLRALIIGLDSVTFDICGEWLEEGLLPNLAGLMDKGAHGELRSTQPPESPTAWTTMLTGKNPGKHGVFSVAKPVAGHDYATRPTCGGDCASVRIWTLLNSHGLSWGSVAVPWTYPPEPVDGFIVACGLDMPTYDESVVWPREMFSALAQIAPEISTGSGWLRTGREAGTLTCQQIEQRFVERCLIAERLVATRPVDVLMVVFDTPDHVQHWLLGDPSCPNEDTGLVDDAIRYCHQAADRAVGRLLQMAGPETIVLCVSDHGAVRLRRQVNLAQWLAAEELLCYGRETHGAVRRKLTAAVRGAVNWAKARSPAGVVNVARKSVGRGYRATLGREVDYARTQAFMPSPRWMQANARDREPRGIVPQGAGVEQVLEQLQEQIPRLVRDGQSPVVRRLERSSAIYHGPWTDQAFDLHIELEEGWRHYPRLNWAGPEAVPLVSDLEPQGLSGAHTPRGMFVGCGGPIADRGEASDLQIQDVAPTLLYLLGLPIPTDMDGRCLEEIVEAGFWEASPVRHEDPAPPPRDEEDFGGYDDEDEAAVREKLRDLGYLD